MDGYLCPYCRMPSDQSAVSCPLCGAPVQATARISDSGWMEQPMMGDMTRIRCGEARCQIAGTLVPVAEFSLTPDDWIYFGQHALLWADAAIRLSRMQVDNRYNKRAGMPVVLLEGHGPGHIGVSDNHAGEVIAVPLARSRRAYVRCDRFLCATGSIDYEWRRSSVKYKRFKSGEPEYEYPMGVYCDLFTAMDQPGLLLLHAVGNTFLRDLAHDESVLVQPKSLVYWDASIQLSMHLEYPRLTGRKNLRNPSSYRTIWLRVGGPGRVAVQSVCELVEGEGTLDQFSFRTRKRW